MKKIILMSCVVVGTFAFGSLACGTSEDDAHEAATNNPEIEGVVYEGTATDEALEGMIGLTPTVADGLKFASPAAGATLGRDVAPAFTWSSTTASVHPLRLGPSAPVRLAFGTELVHLLGVERVAHAHGAPTNGNAALLEFKDAAGARLVRVFTTLTSYTPAADDWAKLNSAAGPITVSLTSAVFDANKVSQGPFSGTTLSFSVQ